MNTEMVIVVSQEDCNDGVRNNERFCVVATAIARMEPEANRIEVNVNTIRFSLKENGKVFRLAYRTPAAVQVYLRSFDAGNEPKPMKIELDNPQIVEKSPTPRLKAKTPSFKPQAAAKTRRSIRVFGEKAFR